LQCWAGPRSCIVGPQRKASARRPGRA